VVTQILIGFFVVWMVVFVTVVIAKLRRNARASGSARANLPWYHKY
jgi:hypothetical protein